MNNVNLSGTRVDDIEFMELIGSGGEGQIYKVRELDPPKREIAAKMFIIPFDERSERYNVEQIKRFQDEEMANWAKFPACNNILDFYGAINTKAIIGNCEYLLIGTKMPLANGDLQKYILRNQFNMSKKELRQFLLDITNGIRAAHDVDIAHRDIKAANILLFQDGVTIVPKIMDFGMSTHLPLSISKGGTPEYRPPEQFDGVNLMIDDYKKGDIYSMGILFYEIITGKLPFHVEYSNDNERIANYRNQHLNMSPDMEPIINKTDEKMGELIRKMLEKDPAKRIQIYKVVRELTRQQEELMSLSMDITIPDVIAASKYRWNVNVHRIMGNELYYYLIRGDQPTSDVAWIQNNLLANHIHGYSIYRILGGYDYLVRIWLKPTYKQYLDGMLSDFSKIKGGSHFFMRVAEMDIFESSKNINIKDQKQLLHAISKCANTDKQKEYQDLLMHGFITSRLNNDKTDKVRFFVVVDAKNKITDFYSDLLYRGFKDIMQTIKPTPKQLSVYSGNGDFRYLMKFRLGKFHDYILICDELIKHMSRAQEDAKLSMQTYVEFDRVPFVESDDGSVVREVSKYVDANSLV